MPRYFEPNWGITDPAVQYLSRGARYQSIFTKEGPSFLLNGAMVQLRFEGAGPFRYEAVEPLASKSHYIAQKVSNVPHYGRLRARGIYPGVDIEFYPRGGEIEFDLIVAPGADPRQIRMTLPGAQRLVVGGGDLVAETPVGEFRLRRPVGRQGDNEVAIRFRLEDQVVHYEFGPYAPGQTLVIDPVIVFQTFVGAADQFSVNSIAADLTGVYVTGQTGSLVTTPGAFRPTPGPGIGPAFLAKFSRDGSQLLYATYLGDGQWPAPPRVLLSHDGVVHVVGAGNLTPTPGALTIPGFANTIVRLNETGSAATLIMHTLAVALAGTVAIDRNGDFLMLSRATEHLPPLITPGAYNAPGRACRLVKVNREGTAVRWSLTYGGGALVGGEYCPGLAVDSQNRVWVAGHFTGRDRRPRDCGRSLHDTADWKLWVSRPIQC